MNLVKLKMLVWNLFYKTRVTIKRMRLTNRDFSVLCNNCVGAMVLHDLGQKFNSPTVNLFIPADDYLSFLENLKDNLSAPMTDITGDNPYPIGLLNGNIHLYFVHYSSFNEAQKAWLRRSKRMNFDNMFVILVERDGCTYNDLLKFDMLPFEHKLALVHKNYPGMTCTKVIHGYEKVSEIGYITNSTKWGQHIYDQIDWVSFLNQK